MAKVFNPPRYRVTIGFIMDDVSDKVFEQTIESKLIDGFVQVVTHDDCVYSYNKDLVKYVYSEVVHI